MQICAVLAAVTEVIRSQGGKETETEYFAALVSGCDSVGVRVQSSRFAGCGEKTGRPSMGGGGRGVNDCLEHVEVLQSFSSGSLREGVFTTLFL